MLRRMLHRRTRRGDSGAALVIVIGLTAVMLLVVGTALGGASSGLVQASSAQSSARALDAAYAGVQDYIAKLNADASYPQYGDTAAKFSSKSIGMSLPRTPNPAFGLGPGGTWANLPGGTTTATFRYEPDNSQYGSSGLLRLRSTGRFGTFTKTIVASIQQQGFINYLYFTNYETQDPQISGTGAKCDLYLWSSPTRNTSDDSCPTIQFGAQDVLQGPVRSNDTLTVCGSEFDGTVTSSNPGATLIATPSGCGRANYAYTPQYAPVLSFPATNTSMRAQTYSDTVSNPGCLFTGPTQITLNAGGTMTVVSPWTQFTRVTSDGTSGTNPPDCGSISDLHSTKGATFPVPPSNLVFVQGIPALTNNVNYTPSTAPVTTTTTNSNCGFGYLFTFGTKCSLPSGATCTATQYGNGNCIVATTTSSQTPDGAVPSSATQSSWNANTTYTCTGSNGAAISTAQSGSSAGWILKDGSGTVRFPLANEDPATAWASSDGYSWDTGTPAYGCRNGDAFVSGTLSGKLTIASDNYVYATGDVLYKDPTSDVLGLVGNNGVLVYNPESNITWGTVNGRYRPTAGTPLLSKNREIDAAILSPAHTFQVQNSDVGAYRGVLTVKGSIAQNYRGPVATTSGGSTVTGYSKKYGYDSRFIAVTPPYYLKPTSASFKVSSYAATAAAFTSTGAGTN